MFEIRKAGPGDAPAVTSLINAAFYPAENFFVDGDRVQLNDVIGLLSTGTFLVAEEDGKMTGCVYLEQRADRMYLGLLSVHPEQQKTGIGSRLLKAGERFGREAECHFIDVKVVNLRTELIPYYRRKGYVETGVSPFPDGVKTKLPCSFVDMTKQLTE